MNTPRKTSHALALRLRQARAASCLTLQAVAERMAELGAPLTRAALSKYETARSVPPARVLLRLARALGTSPQELLRRDEVAVEWFAFRRRARLGAARRRQAQARAERVVEQHIRVYRALGRTSASRFPARQVVRTPAEAEAQAQLLRKCWRLGEAPLESVTATIEDHAGVVVEVMDVSADFDGLSGMAAGQHPVLVVNGALPPDRRRYTLTHELGHLAMNCDEVDAKHEEALAHRFAAAFLVPARVAQRELGERRRHLTLDELLVLKGRYGLSIQAWIRRAYDLEIITRASYESLYRQLGARGWRREEPPAGVAERPASRLRQMILHALGEGALSFAEAREIVPDLTLTPVDRRPGGGPARTLLYATSEQRDQVLRGAAEAATELYKPGSPLRDFEAVDLKDDDDE